MIYDCKEIKGRIIRLKDEVWFYYYDGTYTKVTNYILKNILMGFRRNLGLGGHELRWSNRTDCDLSTVEGETLAYFSNESLVILDASVFTPIISQGNPLEYISADEYAQIHSRSVSRIKKLCSEGRIVGSIKISGKWFIYRYADYPVDKRGDYKRKREVFFRDFNF